MRIVGGRFRGRNLTALGAGDMAAQLRPTSDRVREALFNVLHSGGYDMVGARVLDLFAGTGALGLEALSRGAERVLFVEDGAKGRNLIRKNIDLLQVDSAAQLFRRDATRLGPSKGAAFSVVFADPPYGKGLGSKALAAARDGGWLCQDAVFVLEEGSDVPLPAGFRVADTRRYGDSVLQIGRVSL